VPESACLPSLGSGSSLWVTDTGPVPVSAVPPFWSDVRVMRTKALAAHIWAVGAPRPKGILDGILGGIPGDRISAWDLRSGAARNPGISCGNSREPLAGFPARVLITDPVPARLILGEERPKTAVYEHCPGSLRLRQSH
jgi:hypothetical protein